MLIPDKITVAKSDRLAWVDGRLHEGWAAQLPFVDADDLRIARTQYMHGSHYSEWVCARAIWSRFGFFSLLEKYEFATHPQKAVVLKRLGVKIERNPNCQHPDLLVYRPNYSEWGFVEVKTKRDKLSVRQLRHFPEIERQHGRKIKILQLVEV